MRGGRVHAVIRLTAAVALVGLVLAAPVAARAAPCGAPDLVDMVPPDGATQVPLNATLGAHYTASAQYLGEDVVLVWPTGEEQVVPARFDATEGLLTVTPADPLMAQQRYTIRWPALRGLGNAALGVGGDASFTTGSTDDQQAPTFDGLVGISWDLERAHNDCTDGLVERFLFDVDLGAVSDDGGRQGLTLLVFQTAGPGAAGMSVPVLARALPAEGKRVRIALPTGDAVGHVCFAALVRDMTAHVSSSGDREVCADTTAPPFFRGCSLAPVGRGGDGGAAVLALGGLLLAARARRRRRQV